MTDSRFFLSFFLSSPFRNAAPLSDSPTRTNDYWPVPVDLAVSMGFLSLAASPSEPDFRGIFRGSRGSARVSRSSGDSMQRDALLEGSGIPLLEQSNHVPGRYQLPAPPRRNSEMSR